MPRPGRASDGTPGSPDPSVAGLAEAARQSMQAGRLDEAGELWRQVLALSPEHPQALFHLGQHALLRKDTKRARALLERAAIAAPKEPAVPLNLAFSYRAEGDAGNEMAALIRALTIDPYFYPALLAKAMLLERTGKRKQAARVYKDVLSIAPPVEQMPPELQEPMARARKAVEENAAALDAHLRDRLEAISARHPGENLQRLEECKDVLLGRKKVYTQQPLMLHVPHLPAIQFYDRNAFPWLEGLEAATDAIRDELLVVLREDTAEMRPYVRHPEGGPIAQWAELNHSPRWSVFYLWEDGKRIDAHCARCPRTAAVLDTIPRMELAGFAPTVLFSVLAPHTRIPSHSGDTNARLIVHLPLIVPPNCRFRVGNEIREWEYRKAWIFDDTIEHEAWNDSDEPRVIAMIDIWNPYLSQAERELVTALLNGMHDYYDEPIARP